MATRMFLRQTTANTAGYVATEKSTALPVGTANLAGVAAQDLAATAGTTATTQTLATLAQSTHQDGYFRKFISPALTGVSSITAQTWTLGAAVSQSNPGANAFFVLSVYVLKSDDTVRGYVYDSDTPLGAAEWTTLEGRVVTFSGALVSGVVSTDRLVIEVWYHAEQAMAASYNNTLAYDGTTAIVDGVSNSDPASYLETPQDDLFAAGGTNELASSPAGLSTATATLTSVAGLAASVSGLSTTTANLTQVQPIASTTAGSSTITAALSAAAPSYMVPPTGSSGLTTGSYLDVDEDLPWSDVDEAFLQLTSLASGTAIFSGFDLGEAPGDKKGFQIWARMDTTNATGIDTTITLKQGAATLWTSATFAVTNLAPNTYLIAVPDSAFSSDPGIDNLSLEFAATNLHAGNNRLSFQFLRISKSPFTAAQEAALPSSLTGQEFVCYRDSDLGVVLNGANVLIWPDASGKGRHSILRFGSVTYQSSPEGVIGDPGRLAGTLGYNPATEAPIQWTGNKIFHVLVHPTSVASEQAIFSMANDGEFIGSGTVATKHICVINVASGGWALMSGDGTAPAHLYGGTPVADLDQRVTEWIQASGGNEHLWEEDDASPVIDGSSGDNAFGHWSLLMRESDERPFIGRLKEVWFVEGTGITEAEIDSARDEWLNGPSIELAASVAGLSTITAALTQVHESEVTAAGTATITGVLSIVAPLIGASVGGSTVTGYLSTFANLDGATNGIGSVAASIQTLALLAATTAGGSSASGTLTTDTSAVELAGASTGGSTVTGGILTVAELAGTSSGISSVAGILSTEANLAGTSSGSSSASGNLTQIHLLVASTAGTASCSGNASQIHQCATSSSGASTITGDLTILGATNLAGATNGVASTVAALTQIHEFDGASNGSSSVSSTLSTAGTVNLVGASAGTSSVIADLELVLQLASSPSGQGSISGALTTISTLSGAATGSSTISGNLAQILQLSGTIVGVGLITGDLSNIPLFSRGSVTLTDAAVGSVSSAELLVGSVTGEDT